MVIYDMIFLSAVGLSFIIFLAFSSSIGSITLEVMLNVSLLEEYVVASLTLLLVLDESTAFLATIQAPEDSVPSEDDALVAY
jgi:hypothetical protein